MKRTESKHTEATAATRINLTDETRTEMVDLLNAQLANLTDLYSQTKFAHWNVKGANFIALHKLFDELAEKVEEAVDEVAERATGLGGLARGTLRMAVAESELDEISEEFRDCTAMVQALSGAFAATANSMRMAIEKSDEAGDTVTTDLFTRNTGMLDQSLYFLESHESDG